MAFQSSTRSDAGVVDDDVEPAVALDRRRDERLQVRPARHIGDAVARVAPATAISSTTAARMSALPASSTTLAPRSASSRAVVRPTPLLAPMIATTMSSPVRLFPSSPERPARSGVRASRCSVLGDPPAREPIGRELNGTLAATP